MDAPILVLDLQVFFVLLHFLVELSYLTAQTLKLSLHPKSCHFSATTTAVVALDPTKNRKISANFIFADGPLSNPRENLNPTTSADPRDTGPGPQTQ